MQSGKAISSTHYIPLQVCYHVIIHPDKAYFLSGHPIFEAKRGYIWWKNYKISHLNISFCSMMFFN